MEAKYGNSNGVRKFARGQRKGEWISAGLVLESSVDVQFKRDFGWNALCEFINRDVFFGTRAFVVGLEGHVFANFFDDGGTEVEAVEERFAEGGRQHCHVS